jgi:hypothetical protein
MRKIASASVEQQLRLLKSDSLAMRNARRFLERANPTVEVRKLSDDDVLRTLKPYVERGCSDRVGAAPLAEASDSSIELCICVFKFSIGKLYLHRSCAELIDQYIRVLSEEDSFFKPEHGTWYEADGIFFKNGYNEYTTYKIDGSTCVKMFWDGTSFLFKTCASLMAQMLGKRGPYQVPNDEFGETRKNAGW